MRQILLVFLLLFTIIMPAHAQDAGTTGRSRVSVIVMPLENRAASRSQSALAFGLPAVLAERLEGDPGFAAINGPLVLTAEQARLVSPTGADFDLVAANRLAAARGATHFVTGRFEGQVWQWTFTVDVYAVAPSGPTLVGTGASSGDLTVSVPLRSGRTTRVQSASRIHEMFASAASDAFAAAGMPLAPSTTIAIATPSTNDAYAFLLLSRAYARYFNSAPVSEAASSEESALGIAEHAVLVDPTQPEAQRFYAHLLHEAGRNVSARVHFEVAIDRRPDDVRSLVELGEIEIGERNADVARGYLERATRARPADTVAHYWLGRALLDLREGDLAIAEFERSRTLDDSHVEARRELVRLYAERRRYADAATELRRVTVLVPDDKDAAFLLAACLRAAGMRDEAIASYADGARRFPDEARFHSFRADLLTEAGRTADARAEYETASRLAPRDPRVRALLASGSPAAGELLGGGALVRAVADGVERSGKMESSRATYMLAINDAIFDLQLNGQDACRDGHGASSALLARHEGDAYWTFGQAMTTAANGIRTARTNGEWAALTPDEARNADAVLTAMTAAERDVREMRSLFDATFIPLYRRHECETFDGPIAMATAESVRARYADRRVELPEVRPPTWSVPISPVVPSMPARTITFRVNNEEGRVTYVLTVDGTERGEIAPGRSATFSSRLGPHRICLVPRGITCGDPGTERHVFLHERWTIRVRPGA